METKAVHRYVASLSLRSVAIAALASVAGLALLVAPVSAKHRRLIGRDGKIHGCYRVKGKPKGMLRVVRARRYHCKRGERKVAWSVVARTGATGTTGAGGAQGAAGQPGTQSTSEAKVVEQVNTLTNRVESLESTLAGLTNEELTNAVNALPAVESLCTQSTELTSQVNLVSEAVEGLGLNSVLTGLGGLLEIPPLPEELEPFSCS